MRQKPENHDREQNQEPSTRTQQKAKPRLSTSDNSVSSIQLTMKTHGTILTLLFPILSSRATEECDLNCKAPATCVLGDPSQRDPRWDYVEGMYCSCPEQWTGTYCEVPFVECEGEHICYNGGRCIPGLTQSYEASDLFCNCEKAYDELGNRYVGKHCEQLVSSYCSPGGQLFCLNGGICNPNFP